MYNFFYKNTRLLVLTVGLILVAGLSSFYVLPRMEDPRLVSRIAIVNTRFPGAEADRVEALVTEKLEEELQEIEEIKELRSYSRAGISTITIELRDQVTEAQVDSVWSRARDKLADARPLLPSGALDPEFDEQEVRAYALIAGLTWEGEDPPSYGILRRLTEVLEDRLRAVPGTEEIDTFGDPDEEVLVEIQPFQLASLGLTAQEVSRQIGNTDSKIAAGELRGPKASIQLEVRGEIDSLARLGRVPIHYGSEGQFVLLSDIATIKKGIAEPPGSLALIKGKPAVVLGVYSRSELRIDHWSRAISTELERFRSELPKGVSLDVVFNQNRYVESRLDSLLGNLLLGVAAVSVVIFFMMGWRSALIVSTALPLSALMVIAGMRFLGIPIHQMSVMGLIVALGLLIDNAIVVVDEVKERLRSGMAPGQAVYEAVRHLAVPLFGSTLTTALAFAPIALMPGPAGEFVGSIAISVILAVFSSLLLALTVVPTLVAIGRRAATVVHGYWFTDGFSNALLTSGYRKTLTVLFSRPALGILLGVILPVIGFVQSRHLVEQFFPPAGRDQFYLEVELPAQAPLEETIRTAQKIRARALKHPEVQELTWFLGESSPSFYYNMQRQHERSPFYAQALVQLRSAKTARQTLKQIQKQLTAEYPQARVLARQLEQGPPFNAPVEVRLYGPDLEVLQALGQKVQAELSRIPEVTYSRAELSETIPKLALHVDEEEARLAGLDHTQMAQQLEGALEGEVRGSILEATEELPIRVRVAAKDRADLSRIASLDFMSPASQGASYRGAPLTTLATVHLKPEPSAILHKDGRRMNEVQAFLEAGVLPAVAVTQLQERLRNLDLPPGYTLEYGGEAAKRNEAVGNLMANVGVLVVLMAAALVLSFQSFRLAAVIASVAVLSVGLGVGALWLFGYPFGFMAIVGTMGLVGVAINDAIVVLAALQEDPKARMGDQKAIVDVVVRSTRHVLATTLTTVAGFLPLLLSGEDLWPPLAIAIAGGVVGATVLALIYVPALYRVVMCRKVEANTVDVI